VSPHSLDPRQPREYRRRARVIVAYGISAFLIGMAGLIDPERLGSSSIAVALNSHVDEVWLSAYGLGGLLASVGVVTRRPDVEVAGLWMLLAAALINALAIITTRGIVAGGITAVTVLLSAWVISSRIGDLHSAAKVDRRDPSREHQRFGHERRDA
jgi:hypothetical protein